MDHPPHLLDDSTWLECFLEEQTIDALWPHLDAAEMHRLVRVYGYPKDNALPPALTTRLGEPCFVRDLYESIKEEEDDVLVGTLLEAVALLIASR